MALTLYEAAKQSRNPLAAGVLLAIATSDELISQVPMVHKPGDSWSYNREKALPSVEFVSPTHTSLSESSATFDRVIVPIRLMVSDVDTYVFAATQQSEINNARGIQIMQKLKATGRSIGNNMINGAYATSVTLSGSMLGVASPSVNAFQDSDRQGFGELFYDQSAETMQYRAPGDRTYGPTTSSASDPGAIVLVSDNPSRTLTITVAVTANLPTADQVSSVKINSTTNAPDGLKKMVPTSQTTASTGSNGDALSFTTLDKVIDAVKTKNNLRLIMNSALRRKFYELMRGLGGTTPEHVKLPGINGNVPVYQGIPILRNDNVLSDEAKGSASTLSSIYCVDLVEETGFYAGFGGQGSVDADLSPDKTRIMGVQVRDVGELEGKEAWRSRVSWYGGFGLGSELAAARASELVTA